MIRDFLHRRQRLLIACGVMLGVIVGVLVLYHHSSTETREAVQGICAHNAERRHPGSVIEVESMTRAGSLSFNLTGTATSEDGDTAEFSCYVYSDMHGGWQIAMNGEEPTR